MSSFVDNVFKVCGGGGLNWVLKKNIKKNAKVRIMRIFVKIPEVGHLIWEEVLVTAFEQKEKFN